MTIAANNVPVVPAPERRRLRTFAFDPMSTRLSGRFVTLDVPFESDLTPGPCGELVQVVDFDATGNQWYQPIDLDDVRVLAQDGLRPMESDPRTHQQIVYAVAMSVIERFERFVGRRFRWRAERQLRLVPHAFEGRNAFFDPGRRAVLFGYYRADRHDPGPNLPGQVIFTCLSSDIVAHEVTHAIVHRIRPYFMEPTNLDVLAWHEAFADLVALFHHFVHRDVVVRAVTTTAGDIGRSDALLELAKEFGHSTGRGAALRSVLGTLATPERFEAATEPHERGACFVAAVFDAYLDRYQASIADLLRIATGGTGVLPPGRLHPDLVHRVADEAVKNADRLLGMVVRAFDYLPVVDVTFGDVVRAIVTADRALFPDDSGNLRGTLVEAMRCRGIYPESVTSLADAALSWPVPAGDLNLNDPRAPVDLLPNWILSATHDLDVTGSQGSQSTVVPPADDDDVTPLAAPPVVAETQSIYAQAQRWAKLHAYELGLDPSPSLRIALRGIHVAYRRAADGQPRPEVVLQLTQRRRDLEDQTLDEHRRPVFRAGTTVIAGVDGRVKFIVAKPLPFLDPGPPRQAPGDQGVTRRHHEAGEVRLRALRRWIDLVEESDALSAWTQEPALNRLDFAALHGDEAGRADS
ncbi:hypothetical protein SAMN05660359_00421 [Geodermatophilus obscurus]|uniref:Uncharacterized protein n=1 Tax=Geodermatophilus obscurus TaxID=1861 RepID=A0A1I5CNF5_9ACTN|nr:hypothetical protein [Geodermatophilus obscurus]SFN88396.1 hypothetical protein SAMN05660359_00421 [Geodermatophilus obscurus]